MARKLLFLFRWGVFAVACWYLWREWSAGESTAALRWIRGDGMLKGGDAAALCFVLILMVVNWGIEAFKWRFIVAPVQQLSFLNAFAGTLAGASVSLMTPNRTGEFVGRVMFVRPEVRISASALTVLGSVSQVLITLVVGSACLAYMHWTGRVLPVPAGWPLHQTVLLPLLISLVASVFFLRPVLLRRILDKLPFLRRYDHHFSVLSEQRTITLLTVLLLSFLRYGVFVAQFVLLLGIFGSALSSADAVLAVPVIFLLTTVSPTMMLTELGVRAGVAVAMLVPLGASLEGATWATTLVWSINVLLPALVGSLILLLAHIRTKQVAA